MVGTRIPSHDGKTAGDAADVTTDAADEETDVAADAVLATDAVINTSAEAADNVFPSTAFVIMVFLMYLGAAIWGCTMVREGLERRRLSKDDSYSVQFYDVEDQYFREHPYRVQVSPADQPAASETDSNCSPRSHDVPVGPTGGALGAPISAPERVCMSRK